MITYVKGEYVDKYNLLYEEAVRELKKYYLEMTPDHPRFQHRPSDEEIENLTIEHLADYFCYMHDLTEIDMDNNALKFTKLPLDEKNFKINLDTRSIEIPKELSEISVRGDEIAEIVYFEVDRYYDATDLNETEIIIEWINNTSKQKGYSRPYGKDTNLIPGKIVFGWPLSSKITEANGDVKFAVRFYRADDTKGSSGITYSLSTTEHTIKIRPSIDINLQDIVDKKSDIFADDTLAVIRARATNSRNPNGAQAGVPVIFYLGEELGAADGLGDAVASPQENPYLAHVVYINTNEQEPQGHVRISAGVYPDGDGVTTDSLWMKFRYEVKDQMVREVFDDDTWENMTEEEKADADQNFKYETVWMDYAEVKASEAQAEINARNGKAGVLYYVKQGENQYVKISVDDILAMDADDVVYRLDFTCEITDIGVYQFLGRVWAGSNKEETYSNYIIVFPPVRPKNVHVEGQKMMAEVSGHYEATISAENDPFGTVLDEDLVPPAFVEYDPETFPFDGTREWPTYKWYRNSNVKAAVEELNADDFEPIGGTDKELIALEEGYYKCGIVGNLNNHKSEEILSDPFRVTRPASRFTLTIKGKDIVNKNIETNTDRNLALDANVTPQQAIGYTDNGVAKGLTIDTHLEEEQFTDKLTYKWYRYVCNRDGSGNYEVLPEDAAKAVRGEYVPDLNGSIAWAADVLQENATEKDFVPAQGGVYFCVVTNTYNEHSIDLCSPFMVFSVNEND